MKSKKRGAPTAPEHLYAGGDKVCSFEFPLGRELVKAGDRIKIKNERGWFRFYKVVHNINLGVTWVDVTDSKTGEWRSFYLERVKMVDRPKRSYRKRVTTNSE